MNLLDGLLEGLFDYAGMFPPASRSFEEALAESGRLPGELQRPQLLSADLVLKMDDLERLETSDLEAAGFTPQRGCKICVVGVPLRNAKEAAQTIAEWNQERALAAIPQQVTSLEVHDDLEHDPESIGPALMPARYLLADTEVRIYLEPKWEEPRWNQDLAKAFKVMDAANGDGELRRVGIKFRCTGPNAVAPDTLAGLIAGINERDLPAKATQGLHHPVVEAQHENTYGFVGLVTAMRLQKALTLDADQVAACATESDAGAFSFEDEVRWRDHVLPGTDIGLSVGGPFHIGSCSLHEPDQDLDRLFLSTVVPKA